MTHAPRQPLLTKLIEQTESFGFDYTRHEFSSSLLSKDVRYGCLRPKTNKQDGPFSPSGTLYLLHGGVGDDRFTVDVALPEAFQPELLKTLLEKQIQIILPFVGRSFLHDFAGQPGRAFSRYFRDEMLPLAEAGTRTTDSTRFLAGYSMGGQAALNYFARNAGRFAGVAAVFPTLIGFDYASQADVAEFSKRTGVVNEALTEVVSEFTSEFTDRADFQSCDPMALFDVLSIEALRDKRIELAVGDQDDYGLYEGCRLLHSRLTAKGIEHRYTEVHNGRHDLDVLKTQLPGMLLRIVR